MSFWKGRTWFYIHSWLGLKLSIMMGFILITGTVAVLSHEIDWLINPEMRAWPEPIQSTASWGQVYESAIDAYPQGQISHISINDEPWWAVQVLFRTPSGSRIRIWINPYTGQYQGYTAWFNVQRFLRMTHRHLMLPTSIGIPIVTVFAFPLLATLISGLFFYKKFWLGFFKWPRFNKSARVYLGDLHRLAALWSIWFVLIIVLTSVWYLAEKSLGAAAPPHPDGALPLARQRLLPAQFNAAQLDLVVQQTQQRYPDFHINRIAFPQAADQAISLQGQSGAVLVRARANTVYIDPSNSQALGTYMAKDLNAHQRLAELADPLHFGTWGGLGSRLAWFVFGVILSGLSITGVFIYGLRVVRQLPVISSVNKGEGTVS